MKKLIAMMLALCLILTAAPMVFATETDETETVVRAADECGEGITWAFDGGVLTITGDGKMDDFEENGAPWQAHKDEITEVIIEGKLTYIGAYAFKDCDSLLAVEFGDALYEIGTQAFASCDGLTGIWLPASFKVFGESCFMNCANLEEIHCAGKFPSFRQNCLWGTYATIYFPAESPWGVEYIEQLETAFNGRIQFLASDGSDPYVPTEAAEETAATEAPTEAVTEPVQTEAATEPETEPVTEPEVTEEVTEAPTEAAEEETEPVTEPVEDTPKKSSGSWIGLVIVVLVLCLVGLGAVIFAAKNKKGKYSAKGKYRK